MVRKAKERRRIDQQEHSKLTNNIDKTSSRISQLSNLLPSKSTNSLCRASERCFKWVGYYCCKFSFVPLNIDNEGGFVIKESVWDIRLCHCFLTLQFILLFYKLVSLVIKWTAGGVDLEMALCITTICISIAGLALSPSLFFRRHETIQLLNILPTIMQHYPKPRKTIGAFENLKSVLVVLCLTAVTAIVAVGSPLLSFMVPSMPGSLFYLFDRTGIPAAFPGVPALVWKLLIWPMEITLSSHIMMLCTWSTMILLTVCSVANMWTKSLRKLPVDTLGEWKELQRCYFIFQTFMKLCNSWVKFMIVPTIASISGSIVVTLYITIRHADLPLMLYLCFPYVAISDICIVFWVHLEVLNVVRETGRIQENLMVTARRSFLGLTLEQRQYLRKVGKATRTVIFDIGDLMDYNIDVPIGMWDEILNQLLLMLTL